MLCPNQSERTHYIENLLTASGSREKEKEKKGSYDNQLMKKMKRAMKSRGHQEEQ